MHLVRLIVVLVLSLALAGCGGGAATDSESLPVVEWIEMPARPDGAQCWGYFLTHGALGFSGVSCSNPPKEEGR